MTPLLGAVLEAHAGLSSDLPTKRRAYARDREPVKDLRMVWIDLSDIRFTT